MPMSFPDMKSLEFAAEAHHFRVAEPGETEDQYRQALANHVAPRSFIESQEIRIGKGWDEWSEKEERSTLRRGFMKRERTD